MISSDQNLMVRKIKYRTEQIIMNTGFHVKPFWVTIKNYLFIMTRIAVVINIYIMKIIQHDQ